MSFLLIEHMKAALIAGIALQVLLQGGFLWWYARIKYHARLADIGFHRVRTWNFFFMVIFLFVTSIIIQNGYLSLVEHLGFEQAEKNGAAEQMILQGAIPLPLMLLFAGCIAPVLEEVIFRGFVLAGFLRSSGVTYAIVFSALIFAFAHTNPSIFTPSFGEHGISFPNLTLENSVSTFLLMPIYFALGGLLGFSYLKTKSLYPGIAFHMINNNAAFLLLLLQSHS